MIGRLLLVAVFVVAAVGKLLDRDATARSLIEFGMPDGGAPAAAVVLPAVELAVAALVATDATSVAGAAAASALFVAFTSAMVVNLARGRAPTCTCFGQGHAARVGPATVARNLVLGAVAVAVAWSNSDVSAPVAAAVVAAALAWALVDRRRTSPLRAGDRAPSFVVRDLDGDTRSLEYLGRRDRPLLIVFVAPGCDHCDPLLADVAEWQQAGLFDTVVVASGDESAIRALATRQDLRGVFVDDGARVGRLYGVPGTPSAVAVHDGVVVAPVAGGPSAVRALAASLPARASGDLTR